MNTPTSAPWPEANQRHLSSALARVSAALERHLGCDVVSAEDAEAGDWPHAAPPSLERVCGAFGLSPFERDVLLLCAGAELDSSFALLFAEAQVKAPTFGLALAALPDAHWSALTPDAPLRFWRLIEVGSGESLTTSALRVDECVLHFLAGAPHLDERLSGLVRASRLDADWCELVPSHQAVAEKVAVLWSRPSASWPVVQLCGDDAAAKPGIAAAACRELGLNLRVMATGHLPVAPSELDSLLRLWNRQAVFDGAALLLDCDELDAARNSALARFAEDARGPLFVSCRERRCLDHVSSFAFDVPRPSAAEQRDVWCESLGAAGAGLNGTVDELIAQFQLGAPEIRAACDEALRDEEADARQLGRALWQGCRMQARPRLDELAQRLEPGAAWDDLVLPATQRESLRAMAAQVGQRGRVLERWGFAAKGARGLGLSALFAGPSGTGKTMAAEVLAGELRLDLYRIDLSGVVSKYIGETEKNLRRVFDAAEAGGSILLFDEADALFGKRSEVRDSHDRYANIETSYLLQRMEAYRGLAILTSNLPDALDTAFLRRIRFVVHFPFPDAAGRAEIWRRAFPAQTPTDGLDTAKLARLNVAGGSIRNIALNAAFLASAEDEPVRMTHLLRAARSEYAKLERSLTETEIGGWA